MNRGLMKSMLSVCLAAMGLCLVRTSCSKDKDEEGRPYYTKYVDINIIRCERVSGALMIDFTVTNKQDEAIGLELYYPSVTDNTGTGYSENFSLAIADQNYYHSAETRLAGKGSTIGHIKIKNFDPNDKATSVNLKLSVGIADVELADKPFEKNKIAVVDNRVKEHGVQTNDTKLAYTVISCVRNGDDVDLHFSVTNNTGENLTEFGMGYSHGGEPKASDNLNNNYACSICFDNDDWYHLAETDRLAAGSSIKGTIRIKEVKNSATEITVLIGASAKNYICEDDLVRFLTIPIE